MTRAKTTINFDNVINKIKDAIELDQHKTRKWPDWRLAEEDQAIEHVKGNG